MLFLINYDLIMAQQPSITVTAPNGGEMAVSGENITISWSSSNVTGNMAIELLQNDTLVGVIASAVPVANGQYIWIGGRLENGTTVSGTGFKVRVTAAISPSEQITCLEFGHSGYPATDYCNIKTLPSDFGNGFFFSAWTKITEPVTQGNRRGNQGIIYINGDNWSIVAVNSNFAYNEIDGIWNYNANYMFVEGGGGDFCTYYSTPEDAITLEQCNDWVWVAWQVVVNNDRTITLRQWLKFGLEGIVIPAGNRKYDINFNQIGILDPPGEEITNPLSYDPSNPRSFRLGVDNTYSGYGTPSSSYIFHARVEARSSKPTLLELDAIARLNMADPTAWGDWELNWKDNAPNLLDRSGHGSHLSIQPGGALYQGVIGPDFNATKHIYKPQNR